MPTKSERILGWLPLTFQAAAERSALRAMTGAFGGELQSGENVLAVLMRSHWVDHADLGAETIDDLERMASLYGLAPRADETVEEFREHLKRYVRTFLEGTVTVRGILRVAAEALGLHLDEELDSWWRRSDEALVERELRRDDGARVIFGFEAADAAGEDAHPARVTGLPDLSAGADLRQAWLLRIGIDGAGAVVVDLDAASADLASVGLDEVVAAVDAAVGSGVASHDGRRLTLESPTAGPGSRLEIADGPRDAAGPLLGLPPFTIQGHDARPARVTGTVDLSAGANLAAERFLRVAVDGTTVREVDCAGEAPAATGLGEICAALNAAFGYVIASHDGERLTLTSDASGAGASLAFEGPAAGDARRRLFGDVAAFHVGRSAEPARFTGSRDVSQGIDLTLDSEVVIGIDGQAPVTADCAGADPSATQAQEVVVALNTALGADAVSFDGRVLSVTSPSEGAASEIAFHPAPSGDATEEIFGLPARTFRGAAASPARVHGVRELVDGADVRARHLLGMEIDGGAPVTVDLRAGSADPGQASLDELVAAIDAAAGPGVASHDGRQLDLTSPTTGAGSRLRVVPLETVRRRRFVTRARLGDEASRALLGFVAREARGEDPTAARVVGGPDLSRGVDLRPGRWLRLAVDGLPARDVDCAGPRPRATLLETVVDLINAAFPERQPGPASHDGRRLVLLSPTSGETSRIAFEPPRASDALEALGLDASAVRGTDARGVRLVGTVELSAGVELPAGAALELEVDDSGPVAVPLPEGRHGAPALAAAINQALQRDVAGHQDGRLILTSPSRGDGSRLALRVPGGAPEADATALLFGFAAPRVYRGRAAEAARLTGGRDLSGGVDLRTARTLRISVDGAPARDVDTAAGAADPAVAQLPEIVAAIDSALGLEVASHAGGRLSLASPTPGAAGRLAVEHHGLGDARPILFGEVPAETRGEPARPAQVTGEVDLLGPADLGRRRRLRVAVDGGRPVEVDVAGAAPEQTFLDEVVSALNAAVPGLAAATPDDRLRLASPTRGRASRLEVLPMRHLEIQEYPPSAAEAVYEVRHGERLTVVNRGAAAAPVELEILARRGAAAPGLVATGLGVAVRVEATLSAGERARVSVDPGTAAAAAEVVGTAGAVRPAPDALTGTLAVPRGRSEWIFVERGGSRFGAARFDAARFAGEGPEAGLFDVGRFGRCAFGPLPSAAAEVRLRWPSYQPGSFVLNLPSELPERFGGRFNTTRFATAAGAPQRLEGVVTEPPGDERDLVELVNQGEAPLLRPSPLVRAGRVPRVPIGFEAVTVPFRQPRRLRLGSERKPARLYLAEEGVEGFIEIRAREAGTWGNDVAISARPAGPGRWDVEVEYRGARFENARRTVLGAPLPALARDLLQASPIGILQAKAAGVDARVTRDRAELERP